MFRFPRDWSKLLVPRNGLEGANMRISSNRTTLSRSPASASHAILPRTASTPATCPPQRTCPLLSPSMIPTPSGTTVLNSATAVLELPWSASSTRTATFLFPFLALLWVVDTDQTHPQPPKRDRRRLHQQCQNRRRGREASGHHGRCLHGRD